MANYGVNRRQFLMSALACTVPAAKIGAQTEKIGGVADAIGATEPEFWFGELVDFWWLDEETNQRHSETGKVVGAAWDFMDERWEHRVMWLSSTFHPAEGYPLNDTEFTTADEICKH